MRKIRLGRNGSEVSAVSLRLVGLASAVAAARYLAAVAHIDSEHAH